MFGSTVNPIPELPWVNVHNMLKMSVVSARETRFSSGLRWSSLHSQQDTVQPILWEFGEPPAKLKKKKTLRDKREKLVHVFKVLKP